MFHYEHSLVYEVIELVSRTGDDVIAVDTTCAIRSQIQCYIETTRTKMTVSVCQLDCVSGYNSDKIVDESINDNAIGIAPHANSKIVYLRYLLLHRCHR